MRMLYKIGALLIGTVVTAAIFPDTYRILLILTGVSMSAGVAFSHSIDSLYQQKEKKK